DGTINVNVIPTNTSLRVESEYNEISSVPSTTGMEIVSFTAPIGKITYLQGVFVSGENMSKYKVKLNGNTIDTKRTYFGGNVDCHFNFSGANQGILLAPGDIVSVTVEHDRPTVADYNGRIQTIQMG